MGGERVGEVVAALDAASGSRLQELLMQFGEDERPGVSAAVARARRRDAAESAERARLERLYSLERALRREGFELVAGVDEVGRGALAGPLSAGACVLPARPRIPGLNDSKQLAPPRRAEIAARVREVAIACAVYHVEADELDRLGMTAALKLAMRGALSALEVEIDHVVVDGNPLHLTQAETAVVGGDGKVAAIAAASVIAKVERDSLMVAASDSHPAYGFEINKGYGTAEHMQAIREVGVCVLHRRSFVPCSGMDRLF